MRVVKDHDCAWSSRTWPESRLISPIATKSATTRLATIPLLIRERGVGYAGGAGGATETISVAFMMAMQAKVCRWTVILVIACPTGTGVQAAEDWGRRNRRWT